jgi:hypothetical protein
MEPALTVFYVYQDVDSGNCYYYDPDTETMSPEKPAEGVFLDPDSFATFVFPDASDQSVSSSPVIADDRIPPAPELRAASSDLTLAVPPILSVRTSPRILLRPQHFQALPPDAGEGTRARSRPRQGRRGSFIPNPEQLSLPPDLREDITKFQVTSYAQEYLRRCRQSRTFQRSDRILNPSELFQAEPLAVPIVVRGRDNAKLAFESFRLIRMYTGVRGTVRKHVLPIAKKLVTLCIDCPQIRDEVFFQLLKQLRKNPNDACRLRTWDLLMIIASTVPSSRDSEWEIKSHIAKHTNSKKESVAQIAQFALVRFSARCSIGKPMDPVTVQMLSTIPRDPYIAHLTFGASIYEQLLTQQTRYPKLPIPYILYFFTNAILEKGGDRMDGIFRLSGNSQAVQQMIDAVNRGADLAATFRAAGIRDLSLTFKLWLARLPERIVSIEMAQFLCTVFETSKNYIEFVAELSDGHRYTLKFLCGFLRRIAQSEAATRMGISNLAIVFGPVIVALPTTEDIGAVAHRSQVTSEFLTCLLKNWDTSDIYPLPPELLGV